VKALFRAGNPAGKGQPAITSGIRARGSWFGPGQGAPDVPRDASVLTEEDENRYTAALERAGFFGPDSWYMNAPANAAYARRAQANWRLAMPVLFLHASYDHICATVGTRLADPMRESCEDLTEVVVPSGHWMAQEKPVAVNAALASWLARKRPELWPTG
jgi:pimeloyl-ACP methyl ester carboxylesterase